MFRSSRTAVALLTALVVLLLVPAHGSAGAAPPADLPAQGTLLPAGAPPPPPVDAASWLVADVDTGEVLAAHNPRTPLPPASTLKLLTLLALAPGLDRNATWTAVHEDAAIDGSKVGLVPDSVYTVDDLLHGMMLGSGNDAAHALAGLVGGMGEATARMQRTADQLGARDTVVRNTSGLDAEGQVSTAVDLAVIGRAVLADPELAEIVRTTRYAFPGAGTAVGAGRATFEIANKNRLLYGYEGALGLKNGYTTASRSSFVGAVERDGRRYLVSMLRVEGSASAQTRQLLDWAIANGVAVQPVGSLPDGPEAQPEPPAAAAAPAEDLAAPVPVPLPASREPAVPAWVATLLVVIGMLLAAAVVLRVRVLLTRRRPSGGAAARRVVDWDA
ncbi:MAG: D-alanyl-D-alanine carboxypeptidase family protein [Actinomycetes bacterium]